MLRGLLLFCLISLFASTYGQVSNVKKGDILVVNGVKGIVFKVDESGCHGSMMSVKAFRSPKNSYTSKASNLKGLKLLSKTDGMANTLELFNKASNSNVLLYNYPVFQWCKSLGNGWYIPAVEQLEEFVNYWLGNTIEVDWDDEEDVVSEAIPHKQKVNNILLEAGGIPFLNGVFTSTMDINGKIYVYIYDKKKDYWQFKQVNPMKMDELSVGRAFYDF